MIFLFTVKAANGVIYKVYGVDTEEAFAKIETAWGKPIESKTELVSVEEVPPRPKRESLYRGEPLSVSITDWVKPNTTTGTQAGTTISKSETDPLADIPF